MSSEPGRASRWSRTIQWLGVALALLTSAGTASASTSPASPDEAAISAVLADYARAIETKSIELFRSVKPALSAEEELRLRASFKNAESHSVRITLRSIEVREPRATVHLARRDTIGSIVASFPQTIVLTRGAKGWTIDEIGK